MKYATIDLQVALDQLGGSPKLYRTVALGFYQRYIEVDQTIEKHMKAGNAEEARRLAHSIKGLSGNLGAMQLKERALDLEQSIKEGDPNQGKLLSLFSQELGAVVTDVRRILEEEYNESTSGVSQASRPSTPLQDPCQALIQALSTYRYSEVKRAQKQFVQEELPDPYRHHLPAIMKLIDGFDYDQAIEYLRKICK